MLRPNGISILVGADAHIRPQKQLQGNQEKIPTIPGSFRVSAAISFDLTNRIRKQKGVLQMMQHALKLWIRLHPQDVGAVIDRPRAICNRPYGFY